MGVEGIAGNGRQVGESAGRLEFGSLKELAGTGFQTYFW
jgi:hypothetical protein